MRLVIVSLILLLLCGCATPSYDKQTWNADGQLIERERKWDNSRFVLGKAIGLKIGYDMESYSPVVKLIYGRYESGSVRSDQTYTSDFSLDDVNLFKGEGSSKHKIEIAPAIDPE